MRARLQRVAGATRLTGVRRAVAGHPEPAVRLAVCAIFKDEADYLAEWVTFHRLMGVEEFYLYDNGSSDAWRQVLQPELSSGLVHVTPWPVEPRNAQLAAYRECLRRHSRRARWIAFLDIDEFLFSPLRRSLPDVLEPFGASPGVVAAWRVYGTGGLANRSGRLVTESFLWRAREDHFLSAYGKSIVNPWLTAPVVTMPHLFTHYDRRQPGRLRPPVDEEGRAVTAEAGCSSAHTLRVNHYYSRSEAEARAKWQRGSVTRDRTPPLSELLDPELNAVRDEVLLGVVPELRRRLSAREP